MKLKDSIITGLLAGIIAPALLFAISFYLHRLYMNSGGGSLVRQEYKWLVFSLIPNLILLRYFLKNKQYPISGKTVLIVTIIEVAAYFLYFGIK